MQHGIKAQAFRSTATFLVAAGIVLALLALGLALRETFLPAGDTWPAWRSGTIVMLSVAAAILWICGAILSKDAHKMRRDSVRTFLAGGERQRVVHAIRQFESGTSGEIRVHLQERIDGPATDEAARVFARLGMTKTRERNGVLFLVGVRDRRFAVIGDAGINDVVPRGFWNGVVERVESRFADGRYADGLVEGVTMAGTALSEHFPPRKDDRNELPDDLSS